MKLSHEDLASHIRSVGGDILEEDLMSAVLMVAEDGAGHGAVVEPLKDGFGLCWDVDGAQVRFLHVFLDHSACVEFNLPRDGQMDALANGFEKRLAQALPQSGGTLGQRPNFLVDALLLPDSRAALAEVFAWVQAQVVAPKASNQHVSTSVEARNRLTREDIGSWVFKGNPRLWDYFEGRETEPEEDGVFTSSWSVNRNYRSDLMQVEDFVVLWLTGTQKPGIHEVGFLASELFDDHVNEEHLVDAKKASSWSTFVMYRSVRPDPFVSLEELKAHPILSKCEHFRAPMTSPSYMSWEQAAALAILIQDRVPRDQLDLVGWALDGDGETDEDGETSGSS